MKQSVSFQTDIRAGNTSIFEKSGEDEREVTEIGEMTPTESEEPRGTIPESRMAGPGTVMALQSPAKPKQIQNRIMTEIKWPKHTCSYSEDLEESKEEINLGNLQALPHVISKQTIEMKYFEISPIKRNKRLQDSLNNLAISIGPSPTPSSDSYSSFGLLLLKQKIAPAKKMSQSTLGFNRQPSKRSVSNCDCPAMPFEGRFLVC